MFALAPGESTGVVVRRAELDGVIVSRARYPAKGVPSPMHFHEHAHFAFLIHGADHEVRAGRRYLRRCGDLFFYPAGEPHASGIDTTGVIAALVELNASFLARYDLAESQYARAAIENPNAAFLLLRMQHELMMDGPAATLGLHALALELVAYSRRRFVRPPPPWMAKVAELLDGPSQARLMLADLAAAGDVHPITISKHFRQYFSCSLGEYRRRGMVKRSIPMLRQRDVPLSEVALACGFADQSHFTRVFKQITGFRPSTFRRL